MVLLWWNIEGLEKHLLALEELVIKYKPDFIALQETKCYTILLNKMNKVMKSYQNILTTQEELLKEKDRRDKLQVQLDNTQKMWQHGGTSLSISKKFKKTTTPLPTLTDRLTAAVVEIKEEEVLIMSVYFPTDGDSECQEKFKNFLLDLESFTALHSQGRHIVIMGDWNIRQDKQNDRNKIVQQFCDSFDLELVIPDKPTHISHSTKNGQH